MGQTLAMPSFTTHDGLTISYQDEGAGRPVVLLHGFSVDADLNWRATGILDAVIDAGHRVLMPDARGHGGSDKPHDPRRYHEDLMARDTIELLRQLELAPVPIVGYSMGAVHAYRVAWLAPDEVTAVFLGALGEHALQVGEIGPTAIEALEAEDPESIADEAGRAFRVFADASGADRLALAAVQRGHEDQPRIPGPIRTPSWIVAGEEDDLVGAPEGLAATLAHAESRTVPGDHLTALLAPELRDAILEFLATVES